MKPGKFTHAIAVLLSSIASLFAHGAASKAEPAKTKFSKKSEKSADDRVLASATDCDWGLSFWSPGDGTWWTQSAEGPGDFQAFADYLADEAGLATALQFLSKIYETFGLLSTQQQKGPR